MKHYIFYCMLVIPLALVGCSIGPKYVPPDASIPKNWSDKEKNKSSVVDKEAWWRNFNDPLLNELIEQQAVYNLNFKVAQARMEAAREEYAVASAQLFPTANISGMPPTGTGVAINQLIALTATLDPDLFGKIRQNKQRARANLNSTVASRNFALINLYAEIASSYLELREAQAKKAVLLYNISTNKQMFHFIKSRYKEGYTSYIDMAQQDGLIEAQLAELEQSKAIIIAILHKIELLTGNNPGALTQKLTPSKPIPQIKKSISLGIPSELLRRRQDIIAAEQQVAAAHANIRVAMANLLPQVTIGWLLGWQTQTLSSNLFAIQNPESTLFGTFVSPLFNISLYHTISLRKREKILAVLNYQIAVLGALHDVQTQYNYFQHYQKSATHLKRALDQKRLVLKLSKDTYKKGASNFNTLLNSEKDLKNFEFAYLQNIVRLQIAKINLYRALGGDIISSQVEPTIYKS